MIPAIPMINLLVHLKERLPFVWLIIDLFNGKLFKLLFDKRIIVTALKILKNYSEEKYCYRLLQMEDLSQLDIFLKNQSQEQLKFFEPHPFDSFSLKKLFNNPSFIMFGVFDQTKLVGYFFLRCFINKISFTGRIVDVKYQRQGISQKMGKILLHTAWDSKFRVFGTASKENVKSLKSYQSITDYRVIKELDDNYIYFEYLK